MRASQLPALARAVLLLAIPVAACERQQPVAPSPPPAATPIPVRLQLVAPGTVAPGATVAFSAALLHSDGTRRDVTRDARWNSSNPDTLTVDASGAATGVTAGDTTVSVVFDRFKQEAGVMVIAAGTYRLTGKVLEGLLPLGGATVTAVTLEDGARRSMTTDGSGTFRFYGVWGDVTLTVSRANFTSVEQRLTILSHQSVDVRMNPSEPYPDLRGLYDLRFQADARCASVLPTESMARRYAARVTQTASVLYVTLSEATFVPAAASEFDGRLDGRQATFWFWAAAWGDAPYPNVAEQVGPQLVFTPIGVARVSITPDGAEGTLEGTLQITDSPVSPVRTETCEGAHRLMLTRREDPLTRSTGR